MMNRIKFIVVVTAASVLIFSCSTADQPVANSAKPVNTAATTPAPPATLDQAAMAAEVYATNCMICHKDTGKGGKVTLEGKTINAEDLTAEKIKKMSDEKLIGYVTNGIEDEGMPSFKDKLSADQIKQVVAHVRRLQSQ